MAKKFMLFLLIALPCSLFSQNVIKTWNFAADSMSGIVMGTIGYNDSVDGEPATASTFTTT